MVVIRSVTIQQAKRPQDLAQQMTALQRAVQEKDPPQVWLLGLWPWRCCIWKSGCLGVWVDFHSETWLCGWKRNRGDWRRWGTRDDELSHGIGSLRSHSLQNPTKNTTHPKALVIDSLIIVLIDLIQNISISLSIYTYIYKYIYIISYLYHHIGDTYWNIIVWVF